MKNATRTFVSTFGAISALAGIEHGIGEILQGPAAPAALVFPSWPDSPFFRSLSGEPALSVIPNLLVTGILAVVVSIALLTWAVFFVHRRHGGLVMMALSAVLLLVGGGVFPPIFGMLFGAAASRLPSPRKAPFDAGARGYLTALWPWSYGASILAFLTLVPGVGVLSFYFGVNSDALILTLIATVFITLALTLVSSWAVDAQQARPQRL